MVRHVILWQFKDEYSGAQIEEMKEEIKAGLLGLKGIIPGLLEIQVITKGLQSSNADLMLSTAFTDEAALKAYAVHPAHVRVADEKVRPFMKTRVCLDYETED